MHGFIPKHVTATATEQAKNDRDLIIMIWVLAAVALLSLVVTIVVLVKQRRKRRATPPAPSLPPAYDIPTLRAYYDLTPREGDVLTRMLAGDDDVVIAEKLGITLATVHGHVRRIYEKTDARSYRELVGACRMCEKPQAPAL